MGERGSCYIVRVADDVDSSASQRELNERRERIASRLVYRCMSNENIENTASLTHTVSLLHAYTQPGPHHSKPKQKIKGTRVHACIALHACCSPEYASKQRVFQVLPTDVLMVR